MHLLTAVLYELSSVIVMMVICANNCFNVNVNVNVVYAVKQKFSEEGVGLCEEMGLQPISEQFTTDGG